MIHRLYRQNMDLVGTIVGDSQIKIAVVIHIGGNDALRKPPAL